MLTTHTKNNNIRLEAVSKQQPHIVHIGCATCKATTPHTLRVTALRAYYRCQKCGHRWQRGGALR